MFIFDTMYICKSVKNFQLVISFFLIVTNSNAIANHKPSSLSSLTFSYIERVKNLHDDPAVEYFMRSSGSTLLFKNNSVVYQFISSNFHSNENFIPAETSVKTIYSVLNLELSFINSNKNSSLIPNTLLKSKSNYFLGNTVNDWYQNCENFGELTYRNIYDGIDIVYYNMSGSIKYDIKIAPGADSKKIRFLYKGVTKGLSINDDGNLIIPTTKGDFIENIPSAFQIADGLKRQIIAKYILNTDKSIGFELFNYDPMLPIIIDPSLIFSTFIGGAGNDNIQIGQMIKDTNGDYLVTGTTTSINFPTTPGSFDVSSNGQEDAFILKLNGNGSNLISSTYIGGNDLDFGFGLALAANGDVYFCGDSWSANYPTTSGSYQPIHSTISPANGDITVMKFNNNINTLIWSTFIGGINDEQGHQLAIGSNGNVYVGGQARAGMPTTSGVYQASNNGDYDYFVAILNPLGTNLLKSTYVGGIGRDRGTGIATDSLGYIYLSGYVNNAFPTTPGAFSTIYNGGTFDVTLTKLNPTVSNLVYSTYLGSNGSDQTRSGIIVNSNGEVLITGATSNGNFPVTSGAYSTSYNGGSYDVFLTKLNSVGNALIFSTLIGGSSTDFAYNLNQSSNGEIIITGTCGPGFPITSCAYDNSFNGGNSDAFISIFNHSGGLLLYSTFLGGISDDGGYTVFLENGKAFIFGNTNSTNFPVTTGSYDNSFNGGLNDIFATSIDIYNNFSFLITKTNTSCALSNGSITAFGIGGTPPYVYSINGSVFQSTNQFTSLSAGQYVISIKDSNSCIYTTSPLTILNSTAATVTGIPSSAGCNLTNGSITALAVGGTPPYFYSVNGGIYQASNLFSNLSAGPYILNVLDSTNCSSNSSIINVPGSFTPLVTAVSKSSTCGQANGSILANAVSGVAPYLFSIDGIAFQISNQFTQLLAGAYLVVLKDSFGCISNPLQINVLNVSGASVSAQASPTTCGKNNGSILAQGSAGVLPYTFSINGTTFQNSNLFSDLSPGNYLVTIQDSNNCISSTQLITVGGSALVELKSIVIPADCGEYNGSISASAINGTGPFHYSLDGSNFQSDSNFTGLAEGMYLIHIKDAAGCLNTAACYLSEKDGSEPIIPNIFTPNEDGLNDVFLITGIENCSFYKLTLFNRWGQLMHYSEGSSVSWNGNFNSEPATQGIYYYVLETENQNYSGSLSLLR